MRNKTSFTASVTGNRIQKHRSANLSRISFDFCYSQTKMFHLEFRKQRLLVTKLKSKTALLSVLNFFSTLCKCIVVKLIIIQNIFLFNYFHLKLLELCVHRFKKGQN